MGVRGGEYVSEIDVPLPRIEFVPTADDLMDSFMDSVDFAGTVYDRAYNEIQFRPTNVRYLGSEVGQVREFEAFDRHWRLVLQELEGEIK